MNNRTVLGKIRGKDRIAIADIFGGIVDGKLQISGTPLLKTEAFPVKVGAQGIQDIGWQTTLLEESKNVVAVVSGCLSPTFTLL